MNRSKVLITSFYNENCIVDALNRLSEYADIIWPKFKYNLSKKDIIEYIKDIDGVFAAEEPYDVDVLNAAKDLKFICRDGVGLDNIDLEECKKRGIAVMNSPIALGE